MSFSGKNAEKEGTVSKLRHFDLYLGITGVGSDEGSKIRKIHAILALDGVSGQVLLQ